MNDVSPELALVDPALAERERERLPDPDDCLAPRPAARPTLVPQPPALTLLSAQPEEEAVVEEAPEPADEPDVLDRGRRATLTLAEASPAEPTGELVDEVPTPAVALVPDVTAPDETEELDVPAPTRMPEWVAPDTPPKRRPSRRKGRAGGRRPVRRRVAVAASWVVLCGFLASPLLAFIPSPSGERPTLATDGIETVPNVGDPSDGHRLRWEPVPKAAGYSVVFVDDGVRSDRWSETAELRLPAGKETDQLVTYEWFVYPAFRDGAGYRYGPLTASGEVTMPQLPPTEG
jgi:hypothetical protein